VRDRTCRSVAIISSLPILMLLFASGGFSGGVPANFSALQVGQEAAIEGRSLVARAIVVGEIEVRKGPGHEKLIGFNEKHVELGPKIERHRWAFYSPC
jgi:hypothetical protein